MFYLIFKGDKFIAHTNKKELVKKMKSERKNKYKVKEVDPRSMNVDFLESREFKSKRLIDHQIYNRVVTEEDLEEMYILARDNVIELSVISKSLMKKMKILKLNDEESMTVYAYLDFISRIEEDLLGDETAAFIEDYYDVQRIIDLVIIKR